MGPAGVQAGHIGEKGPRLRSGQLYRSVPVRRIGQTIVVTMVDRHHRRGASDSGYGSIEAGRTGCYAGGWIVFHHGRTRHCLGHDLKSVGARTGVSGSTPDAGYRHSRTRQFCEESVIRGRRGAAAGFLAANISGRTSERINSGQGEVRVIAPRLITIVGGGSEPSVITDGETHRAATVGVVINPEFVAACHEGSRNPGNLDRGAVVKVVQIPLHHRGITTAAVSAIGGPLVGHGPEHGRRSGGAGIVDKGQRPIQRGHPAIVPIIDRDRTRNARDRTRSAGTSLPVEIHTDNILGGNCLNKQKGRPEGQVLTKKSLHRGKLEGIV